MKRLKEYFDEVRGRQAELAEKTGFSTGYLSQLANGYRRPSYDTLIEVARATGIPIEELAPVAKKKRKKT